MSTEKILSPTQLVEQSITEALWRAYEEERKKFLEERPILNHGTQYTYRYHKCRCELCRGAIAEAQRRYRAKNAKPPRERQATQRREVRPDMHGTDTGYVYGCRCEECRQAHRDAKPKSNLTHGTENAYKRGKCRCRSCVRAFYEVQRARRIKRGQQPEQSRVVFGVQHGKASGYQRGCRCSRCKGANTLKQRERREKLKSGV